MFEKSADIFLDVCDIWTLKNIYFLYVKNWKVTYETWENLIAYTALPGDGATQTQTYYSKKKVFFSLKRKDEFNGSLVLLEQMAWLTTCVLAISGARRE